VKAGSCRSHDRALFGRFMTSADKFRRAAGEAGQLAEGSGAVAVLAGEAGISFIRRCM
jgi:hypothetical protein